MERDKSGRPLVLVGGGGHCKSVIDVAEKAGYRIIAILDKPSKRGTNIFSYCINGTDDDIPLYVDKALFLVTVGHIKDICLRITLHNLICRAAGHLVTLISPTAYVSDYVDFGEGTVIMHRSMVNAGVKTGKGCIVNTYAVIEHEVEIGDFCHISTGAIINGNVRIGCNSFIGSNSTIVNGVVIGENITIGAGSVVCRSLTDPGIYVGCPATRIDKNQVTGKI